MERWESFYVIVGSSAAALIGIQFVVVTLVAGIRALTTAASINAFGTPTVVHLAFALVISAFMTAPWSSPLPIAIGTALCGVLGLAYLAIVVRRARRQTVYEPVWEDWVWHGVIPGGSYVALVVAAVLLHFAPRPALFMIATGALALLLIAIHNAWDTVVHVIVTGKKETDVEIQKSGSKPSGAGPAEYFTGSVRIDPLFQAADPARAVGATVTFEPGARTAWHTHPLGQTLIVTSGCGLAQRWGGEVEEIRPGDVVWFPPGEKHWHGAKEATAMTHIAIQERLDGKTVDWLEKVTDEQYKGR